ncbi:Hypothetical protein CINCED_3A004277 [Cinara cedri]|uniref:Uncharacterized protein n=1 Tax=Cinara cedri TaxID=506608 RepID=A0A5E4M5F8_9HEMI|nr:Hypothetical protein CINCED_3A004277 [Cinara cedri]
MTNIQKPPVYKHILPRVLEFTTNNEYYNNHDKNIAASKLPISPPPLPKQTTRLPIRYDTPSDTIRERQSRVDRILEKYRRQPSSSVSRQFSRSISCNVPTESPTPINDLNLLHTTRMKAIDSDEKKLNSGPRSISPYALFDRSDQNYNTVGTSQENKNHATVNNYLSKSYSLKTLGEYRAHNSNSLSSVDHRSLSKSNSTFVNNDEDPPSSSSSSSSTTTSKSIKEDTNHYGSSALLDWTVGNYSEETVSDRIRRRSFYVKLK